MHARAASVAFYVTSDPSSERAVDFADPPVSEVMFSVAFDKPVIDEVGILSDFWPRIRELYPRYQRHAAMPTLTETFDAPGQQMQLRLQAVAGAFVQRYWFLTEAETELVQVQSDRLVFNWRQVAGDEEYPHYETLLPKFIRLLETFLALEQVAEAGPEVGWVELQYINPIAISPTDSGTHGQLAKALNVLVKNPVRGVLPEVEDTQLQERFRILWPDGTPRGRLYLTAAPALDKEGKFAYMVTLLTRGRPGAGEPVTGVQDFLDIGHDLIVRGFVELTTPEMHDDWGKL
jgi:uncharacterized protein (TIGR04255 family)